MQLIICLDDRNGMLFNDRRQSRDGAVCSKILEITAGSQLWMNRYSAKLFSDSLHRITVDADFLEKADADDFCFAENVDLAAYVPVAKRLFVFRWNRHYPADMVFSALSDYKLKMSEDFPGTSHDIITMEVYER